MRHIVFQVPDMIVVQTISMIVNGLLDMKAANIGISRQIAG